MSANCTAWLTLRSADMHAAARLALEAGIPDQKGTAASRRRRDSTTKGMNMTTLTKIEIEAIRRETFQAIRDRGVDDVLINPNRVAESAGFSWQEDREFRDACNAIHDVAMRARDNAR